MLEMTLAHKILIIDCIYDYFFVFIEQIFLIFCTANYVIQLSLYLRVKKYENINSILGCIDTNTKKNRDVF